MSDFDPAQDMSSDTPGGGVEPRRISDLSDIAAVRNYLNRVGATMRSMFRAVIQERDGDYFRDVAIIDLDRQDGGVTVTMADGGDPSTHAPHDTERRDIAREVSRVRWPEPLRLVTRINLPDNLKNAAREDVFEFRDEDGKIAMLQLRVNADGGKSYLPYTYWDDQRWRMMEPDGPLPLWGLDQLQPGVTVFVHEGAKAARAVQEMIEAKTREEQAKLAAHPWGQQLTGATHVGWIGGALAAGRTDWSVLQRRGVTRVIIVADNDPPGHAAVTKISKLLSGYDIIVEVIRVDNRFPLGFDLADPFPESMFTTGKDGVRRYSGLSFADVLQPATWATTMKVAPAQPGPGRPSKPIPVLRPQFSQQWVMVAGEGKALFVNLLDPSRLLAEDAFNTAVQPYSDVEGTSKLFKKHAFPSHVSACSATITESGRRQL